MYPLPGTRGYLAGPRDRGWAPCCGRERLSLRTPRRRPARTEWGSEACWYRTAAVDGGAVLEHRHCEAPIDTGELEDASSGDDIDRVGTMVECECVEIRSSL